MKKEITTLFLTLATAVGFAQEPLPEIGSNLVHIDVKPIRPSFEEKVSPKRSFGYLRMALSDSQLPKPNDLQIVPGLGVGYRLASGSSAIDISASYNQREYREAAGKQLTYAYTLPKVNYFYYTNPLSNTSLYAGGGLAVGGMKTKDDREFLGFIPNLALGLELNRNAAWRTFVQFDVSQPAIAAIQKGNLAGPFAELSLGAGF